VKLSEIADQFQLESRGDTSVEIIGIAAVQDANAHQLTFLFSSQYRESLRSSDAAAVVLRPEDVSSTDKPVLISENPRMSWARIATLFESAPLAMPFIHPSAVISDLAKIGQGVAIGANSVIEAGAEIGDRASIGAGCYLGEGSIVGVASRLYQNVSLYHDVIIGERCIVHAGAVIGADGFGYEFDGASGDYIKIPQIYGVRIGDDVELGASTTVDRGALNHTSIGDGCKLDNQVQIGHGTQIDHHTVISGCTAIAGSTRIGSYCLIGGAVGIVDNIEITDRVEITAMTLVSQSILKKGRYSSGTGLMQGAQWKRSVVGFRKLDDILKRLRRLESDQ
jgi:UDP-3-O-[3-hydroxymyristoyl] glucosamine N-acyltransferase